MKATKVFEPTIKIVRMNGMKFVPETVEVNIGDTVRWINEQDQSHNVMAKDKSFESILFAKGDRYEHPFKKTGEFDYYCQPHRFMRMKGRVIVKNQKQNQG